VPLPWAIKRLTSDNARAIGLNDRGIIRCGSKADINVIDYDRLNLHAPEVVYDLPAGGRRLIQRIDGYVATLVSGEIVMREGQPTGALPGRLVRGWQVSGQNGPERARTGQNGQEADNDELNGKCTLR
jgi:N-acyl-D-aspartate/D-glutamate deacylase